MKIQIMKSIYRPIGKFLTRGIKGEKDTNEQYLRQNIKKTKKEKLKS